MCLMQLIPVNMVGMIATSSRHSLSSFSSIRYEATLYGNFVYSCSDLQFIGILTVRMYCVGPREDKGLL